MSSVLLDTSAYAAFMRGHGEVEGALQQSEEIYVNPVVLGELMAGFKKGKQEGKNLRELQAFLESTRVRLVDIDEEVAERYAVILDSLWKAGTPVPTNDIWIAATAMQHGLRVLTTDSHYLKITQVIVDCYEVS